MNLSQPLDLAVSVPADQWAYMHRRAVFLEMLVLRLSRDSVGFQEWVSAADLAALSLPGLPLTRAAIVRRAGAARWRCRRRRGAPTLYHVTSLPSRAFDALISRMLDMPDIDQFHECDIDAVSEPVPSTAAVAAPPWVLPLMRLYRGVAGGDIARAWQALPGNVPEGMELPSIDEAAVTLYELGLAAKIMPQGG